jgi:soluble lytic murein transglycosylase-like protein
MFFLCRQKGCVMQFRRSPARSFLFRYRTLNVLLFLVAAACVTSFLNIPQLRTFAPLALARTIKQGIALSKQKITAPADLPSSGDAELDGIILQTGVRRGVDPRLIHFVIQRESNYHAGVVSPRGACGLMQLMPATAHRFQCANPNDPRANIDAGTKYLRWLLERYKGDVARALAAYNAGEGAVDQYDGVPPFAETRDYVENIIANYGKRTHPVLSPEEAKREFNLSSRENDSSFDTHRNQTLFIEENNHEAAPPR